MFFLHHLFVFLKNSKFWPAHGCFLILDKHFGLTEPKISLYIDNNKQGNFTLVGAFCMPQVLFAFEFERPNGNSVFW